MKVITGSRRSGRTTEIIKTAREHNATIVCASQYLCKDIKDKAKQMGYADAKVVTFEYFISRYMAGSSESVVIDNLDLCLEMWTRIPVVAMSCLAEETITLNRDPEFKKAMGLA